jgi:hypothetical protein
MRMSCGCTFIAPGLPLSNSTCEPDPILNKPKIHEQTTYACLRCDCRDYAPRRTPRDGHHWPICICGHVSQEHN